MSSTAAARTAAAPASSGSQPQPSKPAAGSSANAGSPSRSALPPEASSAIAAEAARHHQREKFIPVTRFALLDRLSVPNAWPAGQARDVRRFFRNLDYWRHQQYSASLLELEQVYEPFSPDSDLLMTRKFTAAELGQMQRRVVDGIVEFLEQANYKRINLQDVEAIITRESHYGLDLHVDFAAFEECHLFFRGADKTRAERRNYKKFGRKEEFDVPIYQRLFLLFKLKPFETRVLEVMAANKLSRKDAEKLVKRKRALVPDNIKEGNIYMKLFKNIPRTDLEMVFPNTQVKFRTLDKLKLGASAGGGLGMGLVGAAGKIALVASNPVAAAGAAAGLGAVAFRQAMNFVNQKQRYMVIMAQNLYFHSLADNRGVMIKLASRAAEEDVKEEMLLYTVLVKERARRSDLPAIDKAIEEYLFGAFGVHVDFDLEDALERLISGGLVEEQADGSLVALAPKAAADHIDFLWDRFLDELPDLTDAEGREFEGTKA